MMFQYLHTIDVDDGDSVFLYWRHIWWCFQYFYTEDIDDDASSIHILEIQMMIVQYSHTEYVNDDGWDDDVTRRGFRTNVGK